MQRYLFLKTLRNNRRKDITQKKIPKCKHNAKKRIKNKA